MDNGKSFHEFDSMSSHCQAYQEAYNEIASNQNKHYKVFFQRVMLEKLPEVYKSLVATMNTK